MEQRSPLGARATVMEDRVALDERAAARILASEANGSAFKEQGTESEQFTKAPVNSAFLGHLVSPLEHRLEFRVHRETGGWVDMGLANAFDYRLIDGGGPTDHHAGIFALGFRAFQTRNGLGIGMRFRSGLARFGEYAFELLLIVTQRLLGFFNCDVAAANERLCVEFARRALGLDKAVHQRLGHRGIIALVVTTAAVTNHVDDDVFIEALTVFEGEFGNGYARLGIIAVYGKYGQLVAQRHIGRIGRGTRGSRTGRKAHLVVDNHVDRSTGSVAAYVLPGYW